MLSQVKVRNDDQAVLKYFASFNQPHQAVVECTMNWYWIADLLNDHDFPCVVAHAKYLKAISYAKVKTDVNGKIMFPKKGKVKIPTS